MEAFHRWCQAYGPPEFVYVDPDQKWMSAKFQEYLKANSIQLIDAAAESHWQIGKVEVADKVLQKMQPKGLEDITATCSSSHRDLCGKPK